MTDKKSSIWIDLTDLFSWRGNFTGIQRVTFNYAARYAKKGARFFVYQQSKSKFVEIELNIVAEEMAADTAEKRITTRRQAIKHKLQKRYQSLPRPIQQTLDPLALTALRAFRKVAHVVLHGSASDWRLKKRPTADFKKSDKVIVLGAAWNNRSFISTLSKAKKHAGFKLVLHLNDILPIYQPQLFEDKLVDRFSKYVNKALPIADAVTVISKATKKDIEKYAAAIGLDKVNVEVIRLGEDATATKAIKPDIENLRERFILAVGTFEVRKNYILLYQAAKLAQDKKIDLPQIVIAGRNGWLAHDLNYVLKNDPSIKSNIIHISKASDQNLAWLYKNCLFSVFPSICEGWGLPVAESLQQGRFCLSSNTSSMPEIAGDMIDYFSPFDPKECLEKIVHYSQLDLNTINNKIKKEYKPYSWDDSFKDLSSFVQKV